MKVTSVELGLQPGILQLLDAGRSAAAPSPHRPVWSSLATTVLVVQTTFDVMYIQVSRDSPMKVM